MYYLNVYQPSARLVRIEIRIDDDPASGYISASKKLDGGFLNVAPATVFPSVSFHGPRTPAAAREIAEWWKVAATTAETLDRMIKTPADLRRPITARMVSKTVTIDFAD